MKGRDGTGWDDRRTMLKHKQMTDYGPWMKGQTDVEMEVEIVFRTKHVCYIIRGLRKLDGQTGF